MRCPALPPVSRRSSLRRLWLPLLLCTLLICGCSAVQLKPDARSKADVAREWPVADDGSRIVFVKSIEDFKDLGGGKGFWTRAYELLSGGEAQRSIVRPYGVLHDRSGKLYLADPGAGVVHCLDLPRGRYSVIGGGDAPLRSPIGLASDGQGKLYITDSITGMVYRYDASSDSLQPFLLRPLTRPTGIAYNSVNKMLYVTDTVESQIVSLGLDGIERGRLGTAGGAAVSFNHPTDIAVDPSGLLLVTDSLNFRITVLTPEGEVVRQFGAVGDAAGQFSRPKGIAVDSAGHIYVCDALRDAVLIFDESGRTLASFGRAGSDNGQFWMPSGLFIDQNDYIYVTDTYNKRIQVFRYLPADESHSGDLSELQTPTGPRL